MDFDTKVMLIELDSMKRKEDEYIKEIQFLKDEIKKYKALVQYADARINLEMVKPIKHKKDLLTVLEYKQNTYALIHTDQYRGAKK